MTIETFDGVPIVPDMRNTFQSIIFPVHGMFKVNITGSKSCRSVHVEGEIE